MNKEKAIESLKAQTISFGDLPGNLKEDKDIVLTALKMHDISFKDVPEIMKQDKVFAIQVMEENGHIMLHHFPENLQQDRELVTEEVKSRFSSRKYISEELWSDKEFTDKLFNEIFESDPLLFETKVLSPTEDILMKGFGCNSIGNFVGTAAEDDDSESFIDLIDDNWQISEMSPGESKSVGNEVDICCYHSIVGPDPEGDGKILLKFFVITFQVEPIHMVFHQIVDAEGDACGYDAMFFGSHGVGPISENDYCSEMMEDLENTDDDDCEDDDDWEEED